MEWTRCENPRGISPSHCLPRLSSFVVLNGHWLYYISKLALKATILENGPLLSLSVTPLQLLSAVVTVPATAAEELRQEKGEGPTGSECHPLSELGDPF